MDIVDVCVCVYECTITSLIYKPVGIRPLSHITVNTNNSNTKPTIAFLKFEYPEIPFRT